MTQDSAEPDYTLTWDEVEIHLFRISDSMHALEEDGGLAAIAKHLGWNEQQRGWVIKSLADFRVMLDSQSAALRQDLRRWRH